MLFNPPCPICSSNAWLPLGTRCYVRRPSADLGAANQIRQEIFFDLWLNAEMDAALCTSACARCGFVTYMPRPEHADIESKYKHLETCAETSAEFRRDLPSDRPRSRELYRTVQQLIPSRNMTVLDFGGGKGRLLYAFVDRGYPCFVSDYVNHVIDGVRFLGPDLDVIVRERTFDLVICSHVIEHVADPVGVLRKLSATVAPGGHLYIEVPLELWRHVPPRVDPITHVNFFTLESLRTTLEMAGYNVRDCRYEPFMRPNGRIGMAIKAVAQPGRLTAATSLCGTRPVTALIYPSFGQQLWRLIRYPRLLLNLLNLWPGSGFWRRHSSG